MHGGRRPGETCGSLRRAVIIATCCTAVFMVMVDATSLVIALPAISRSLHLQVSGLQWTSGAYPLAAAALVITAGAAGDRFGRRTVLQAGAGVFLAGSLLCTVAHTLPWLVAGRAIQGSGGAALSPMALAIITSAITDPARRSRAIGGWSAAAGLGVAAGPVTGGLLLGEWGWRAIFWANLPAALVVSAAAALAVPDFRARRPRRADWPGQGLVTAVLVTLTYAIIEGPAAGWRSPVIIACFALSLAAAGAALAWESRIAEPLIDPRMFRSLLFSGANVITLISSLLAAAFNFLSTLYLQDVRAMTALLAGVCLTPVAAGSLLAPAVAGRRAVRLGPRIPLIASGSALTLSCAALSTVSQLSPIGHVIVMYAVFGSAFGVLNAVVTTVTMTAMPQAQAGVAGGISSTCRQLGQALGASVIGSVFAVGLHGSVSSGFIAASGPAWWVMTACAYAIPWVACASTSRRARRTAAATAVPPPGPGYSLAMPSPAGSGPPRGHAQRRLELAHEAPPAAARGRNRDGRRGAARSSAGRPASP